MRRLTSFPSMVAVATCLSGCATPFAQKLDYDPKPVQAPAAITVSDPKVYSRQGLISERQKDVEWINQLLDESRTQTFAPELLREIEQISTFAAALGVKFDPAAGLNYRRDEETGDIQQEIDVLKMQFQLEQLRRDLALLTEQFPEQTDPVNTDLGKLPAGATPDASSAVSASSADQLKEAIGRLLPALKDRLDADGKAPKPSTATVSPIDLFRDRSAYRDLLKSARNAASLDEVHDSEGAVLVRLNFQAAVVPDPKYPRSLGAVQIKPSMSTGGPGRRFLEQWAVFLNSGRPSTELISEIDGLVDLGLVNRFNISTGLSSHCGELREAEVNLQGCQQQAIVIPALLEDNGSVPDWESIFNRTRPYRVFTAQAPIEWFRKSLTDLSASDIKPEKKEAICQVVRGNNGDDSQGNVLQAELKYVAALTENQEALRHIFRLVRDLQLPIGEGGSINNRVVAAENFVANIANALPKCADTIRAFLVPPKRVVLAVTRADGPTNGIRIYEVGPREQVQQVSTVARTANSLALAVSLAASDPGSGAAAEAAASYSKQAIGRADARERVPSVVGYANGSDGRSPVFGWVIGPQARIDPKGKVKMVQPVKAYDLSVDLSAPSYADELLLEVTSLWGPLPTDLATGLSIDKGTKRTIRVPMPIVTNDFQVFNRSLIGARAPSGGNLTVAGGPVSACRASALVIFGASTLWRAKSVLVGNTLLDSSAISILPDMRGVSIKVPEIADQSGSQVNIMLLTPDGNWLTTVDYIAKPADGCEQKKPTIAPTPSDSPTVTGIDPRDGTFIVPGPIVMRLTGAKLDTVDAVTLRAVKGTISDKADDGTSLTVSFATADTQGFRSQDNEKVVLYVNKVPKAEQTVRLVREKGD
jgi:hypothetical protein